MELIENLLQLLTTFLGAVLSGIAWQKSRRQAYFLLLCFYGCFALGSLYWTLYLLLFHTTPPVFYVSEFGWVPLGRRAAAGVLLHLWGYPIQPDLVRLDDLAVLLRGTGAFLCEYPDRRSAE